MDRGMISLTLQQQDEKEKEKEEVEGTASWRSYLSSTHTCNPHCVIQ